MLFSSVIFKGYSTFIDKIRKNSVLMPYEKAVDEAVRYCIDNGILEDVLSEERSAVMLEMLTQFDEKSYEEGLREEGRAEGRAEERANTEKERLRADEAEKRAEAAEKILAEHGLL